MTLSLPNPLIAGFNPDPSIVRVGDDYYLATSTFEYLPGLPIYHSTDLVSWRQIGNVATRPGQLAVEQVPTGGGAWAPTIRHRDGAFHLVVTDAMGRGTLHFAATAAAGPWSDGAVLTDDLGAPIDGIDPDLAWDDDGVAYVTYSALGLSGDDIGAHRGIEQVRVDLDAGRVLTSPRSLWSGTGGMFPEAPHLYRHGGWWYLVVAEGGTERGHSVSIARSRSPEGPFTPGPANPLVTARGTDRPVQNTGHADLVVGPDDEPYLVMLGVRPRGMTRAFAALGRETFVTPARWTAQGWLEADPVELAPRPGGQVWVEEFDGALGPQWLGVRQLPTSCSSTDERPGWLVLHGESTGLDAPDPVFVGVRQQHQTVSYVARVDVSAGVGGLAVRYDEHTHYEIEAGAGWLVARAVIPGFVREERVPLPGDLNPAALDLMLTSRRPDTVGFGSATSDLVGLGYGTSDGATVLLAEIDGRSLSAETAASFTGRVVGLYARTGTVAFDRLDYRGDDT